MPYNLIGHIIILMADVKPFIIIYFILVDVIAKVTVADLIAKVYGKCYCHNSVVGVVTTCNIVLC